MTKPYRIIFDTDLWPVAAQNQTSLGALSPQSYTPTPILIPDQQVIQDNSPTLNIVKKNQAEVDIQDERSPNQRSQNNYIQEGISKQDIAQIIDEKITNLKIYVLESDITQAQNSIKSVVELASF